MTFGKGAFACAVLGFACSDPEVSSKPTWYRDVLPITQTHCMSCHTAGGVGSFSMDLDPADPESYAGLQRAAKSIATAVRAGHMPPFPPDPACREYLAERRVSDDEKHVVQSWADSGAARGDPKDAPLPLAIAELDRVDLALELGESYLPTSLEYTDVQCFVLDPALTVPTDVTGLRVIPGSQRVRDVLVFRADRAAAQAADAADAASGFDCFGSPLGGGLVGSWVPGMPPMLYPEGTAVRLDAESALVLQITYDLASAEATEDRTGLELRFADAPVARPVSIQVLTHDTFSLPAMTRDVTASTSMALADAGVVWGVAAELRRRGEAASLRLQTAGGPACLLEIPNYNAGWQELYLVRDEAGIGFAAGDTLELDCTWDNSSMLEIGPGPNPTDELCVAYLLTTAL